MANQRKLHPHLKIFDNDNPEKEITNFTALPTFFYDDLMRLGTGIPASFWKFTFGLMRQVLATVDKTEDGKFVNNYTWKSTFLDIEERYGLGDRAVQDWTNAYSVSGLFDMTKGKRKFAKDPNGIPTLWRYRAHATKQDWIAFVVALSQVLNPETGKRMARHGKGMADEAGDADNLANIFRLVLACRVDVRRETVNGTIGPALPPVNTRVIEYLIGLGAGSRNPDGTISYTRHNPDRSGVMYAESHNNDGSGL